MHSGYAIPCSQGVYNLVGEVKHLRDPRKCHISLRGKVQMAKGAIATWESEFSLVCSGNQEH